ncbi:MAG: F0F1 ATP synthase subunit B [Phycisphaerales bacterium]
MPETVLVNPLVVLAASEPTSFYVIQFITALIAFSLAVAVLGKVAWPKILGALDEREQKILGEINAAEEARERANAALKEYETSLAEARAEANAMIEKTKADQSRLAAELSAKAEAQAQEHMAEARRNIEAMKKAAVAEVYQEAAKAAAMMASKILEREVNADDQKRLVDDAVSTFSGSGA